MYRILGLVVIVGLGVTLAVGCSGSRSSSGSSWFGDTQWTVERPYASQDTSGRSYWYGGADRTQNQWGSGMKGLADGRTYDADILAACHDLNDSKLAANRVNAANRLGELNADVNIAIEALEHGCKDASMDVRFASASALQKIGSPNAMHHLAEAQQKGYVPSNPAAWRTSGSTTRPSMSMAP